MAMSKTYIITVQYLGVYADPMPTEEQIIAELNVDPISITIEDAIVTPRSKEGVQTSAQAELDAGPASAVYVPVTDSKQPQGDAQEPAVSRTYPKSEAPFAVYDLDRDGPSMKILSLLYRDGKKGRTLASIRESTGLTHSSAQSTVSRLKGRGRLKITGMDALGTALYAFVQ